MLRCFQRVRTSSNTRSLVLRRLERRHVADNLAPTTLGKISPSDQAPLVEGYSSRGFVIRGNRVMGSVALLPRALLHWKVSRFEDLTPESFVLFHLVQPKLDLVVLGTGSKVRRVPPEIYAYLKKFKINLEVQDTPNACATFNFLLDEGRPVGAALIPPELVPA